MTNIGKIINDLVRGMPGWWVERLDLPGIFWNIDKSSSGGEKIMEHSTQFSILLIF